MTGRLTRMLCLSPACLLDLLTAVVGAGIGGSAVAHFLQQHFGPRVQIDVYEKGTVGGRLATISVNKQHYESGAACFHSLSLHMQDFVKQLGECTMGGSGIQRPGWWQPSGPSQIAPPIEAGRSHSSVSSFYR